MLDKVENPLALTPCRHGNLNVKLNGGWGSTLLGFPLFTIFDLLSNTSEYALLASPGFILKAQLPCSDRFSKITEYILLNFDKDITLSDVASKSNMAITTFCNFFKENYRVTFIEYLNNVRIGYASRLISDMNKNIVEVAYESGYKSLANFNRQFKKFKNMTPTEYRRTVNLA